jgi:predicted MFS family arabinose efflux permease
VFARGQIVEGVAMLGGSVAGGAIAQATDLGVPYVLRVVVLVLTCLVAWRSMHDVGFTPSRSKRPLAEVQRLLRDAVQHGLGNPPVRWVMLEAPFSAGVTIYAFYALQPYLLELYGDPHAYGVAGLAAAIIAGAQILGGLLVPRLGRVFQRRTSVMLLGTLLSAILLALVGLAPRFWLVVSLLVLWGLIFAAVTPVRQAYMNGLIASSDRATVLSFDSLLGSGGGVIIQPALGRTADAWGYPASYAASAVLQALALPFLWLARRQRAASDDIGSAAEASSHTSP